MSIIGDVRNDIRAAQKIWIPWKILLPGIIVCVPLFWIFDRFGSFNMALPALNCLGMFIFLIYLKRNLIKEIWFWAIIVVLVFIHIVLIWYIPWTENWVPALAVAVISSADICLIFWIIALVKAVVDRKDLQ